MSPVRKRLLAGSSALAAVLALGYFVQVHLWVTGLWHGLPPATSASRASTLPGSGPSTSSSAARPSDWALPLEGRGLENFFKVSDSLYRGRQPTEEGFDTLKSMGVRTIVNLRVLHSDARMIDGDGFKYVEIEFDPFHPEKDEVVKFLKVMNDPANWPIFVHCQHGSDRTGTMVAAYRIVIGGWSNEQALEEMVRGGYGFHEEWVNLAEFVRRLDGSDLRRRMERAKE